MYSHTIYVPLHNIFPSPGETCNVNFQTFSDQSLSVTPSPPLLPLICHSSVGALGLVGAGNCLTWREGHLHDSGTWSLFLIWTLQKLSYVWSLLYSDCDTWAEHPLKDRLSSLNLRFLSFRTSPDPISNKIFSAATGISVVVFKSYPVLKLVIPFSSSSLWLSQMVDWPNYLNPLYRRIYHPRSLKGCYLMALNSHPSLGIVSGQGSHFISRGSLYAIIGQREV